MLALAPERHEDSYFLTYSRWAKHLWVAGEPELAEARVRAYEPRSWSEAHTIAVLLGFVDVARALRGELTPEQMESANGNAADLLAEARARQDDIGIWTALTLQVPLFTNTGRPDLAVAPANEVIELTDALGATQVADNARSNLAPL